MQGLNRAVDALHHHRLFPNPASCWLWHSGTGDTVRNLLFLLCSSLRALRSHLQPLETCGDTWDCFSPAHLTPGGLWSEPLSGPYRYRRPQFWAHLCSNNCSNHSRLDLPSQTPLSCFSPLPDAWKSCCASLSLRWEM